QALLAGLWERAYACEPRSELRLQHLHASVSQRHLCCGASCRAWWLCLRHRRRCDLALYPHAFADRHLDHWPRPDSAGLLGLEIAPCLGWLAACAASRRHRIRRPARCVRPRSCRSALSAARHRHRPRALQFLWLIAAEPESDQGGAVVWRSRTATL